MSITDQPPVGQGPESQTTPREPDFWQGYSRIAHEVVRSYGHKIGPYGLSLYLALASYADYNTGECYPKLASLAKLAGMSERQARRHLRVLQSFNLVNVKPRQQDTNVFTLPHIAATCRTN